MLSTTSLTYSRRLRHEGRPKGRKRCTTHFTGACGLNTWQPPWQVARLYMFGAIESGYVGEINHGKTKRPNCKVIISPAHGPNFGLVSIQVETRNRQGIKPHSELLLDYGQKFDLAVPFPKTLQITNASRDPSINSSPRLPRKCVRKQAIRQRWRSRI